jgi:hypothetical protein
MRMNGTWRMGEDAVIWILSRGRANRSGGGDDRLAGEGSTSDRKKAPRSQPTKPAGGAVVRRLLVRAVLVVVLVLVAI